MLRNDARKAPDTPPSAAPTPYASSFERTIGTPALAAATSSSRSAIHARPRRESRSRTLTTSISATSASANQYQGRRSSAPKRSMNGRSIRSTPVIPFGPPVSEPPKSSISRPCAAICPMISPNASVTMPT